MGADIRRFPALAKRPRRRRRTPAEETFLHATRMLIIERGLGGAIGAAIQLLAHTAETVRPLKKRGVCGRADE